MKLSKEELEDNKKYQRELLSKSIEYWQKRIEKQNPHTPKADKEVVLKTIKEIRESKKLDWFATIYVNEGKKTWKHMVFSDEERKAWMTNP